MASSQLVATLGKINKDLTPDDLKYVLFICLLDKSQAASLAGIFNELSPKHSQDKALHLLHFALRQFISFDSANCLTDLCTVSGLEQWWLKDQKTAKVALRACLTAIITEDQLPDEEFQQLKEKLVLQEVLRNGSMYENNSLRFYRDLETKMFITPTDVSRLIEMLRDIGQLTSVNKLEEYMEEVKHNSRPPYQERQLSLPISSTSRQLEFAARRVQSCQGHDPSGKQPSEYQQWPLSSQPAHSTTCEKPRSRSDPNKSMRGSADLQFGSQLPTTQFAAPTAQYGSFSDESSPRTGIPQTYSIPMSHTTSQFSTQAPEYSHPVSQNDESSPGPQAAAYCGLPQQFISQHTHNMPQIQQAPPSDPSTALNSRFLASVHSNQDYQSECDHPGFGAGYRQ